LPHVYKLQYAQIVIVIIRVKKYKNMRVLRLKHNEAVKKNGYIDDAHVPGSSVKHSLSGQVNWCAILFRQKPIIGSKKLKENHITPPSERWHLIGPDYCFGVGKQRQHIMNQRI
jgi:hypothetical protein